MFIYATSIPLPITLSHSSICFLSAHVAHTQTPTLHTHRYCNMAYIADQLFPPIATIEESAEFSNFNYWREPVFELDDLVPQDVLDGCIVATSPSGTVTSTAAPVTVDLNASAASAASAKDKDADAASSPPSLLSTSTTEQASGSAESVAEPVVDAGSPSQHSSNKSLPTIPEYHKV